jgi:hypothetical protein
VAALLTLALVLLAACRGVRAGAWCMVQRRGVCWRRGGAVRPVCDLRAQPPVAPWITATPRHAGTPTARLQAGTPSARCRHPAPCRHPNPTLRCCPWRVRVTVSRTAFTSFEVDLAWAETDFNT